MNADDIAQAKNSASLGPVYFAARRYAEYLMANSDLVKPMREVVDRVTKEIGQALDQHMVDWITTHLDDHLERFIRANVDETVQALLSGNEWALKRYVLCDLYDTRGIQQAVAKHCGDAVAAARIKALEEEVERLKVYRY